MTKKVDINIHLNGTLIFAFLLFLGSFILEILSIVFFEKLGGIFVPVSSVAGALAGSRKLADRIRKNENN